MQDIPSLPGNGLAPTIVIAPIAPAHAASYRACLDLVAREKQFLAQVEALPLERIRQFVAASVADDAVQFVALAQYRGQGIGEQLLAACIAKAAGKGMTRIELETRVDNQRAPGLYRKLGLVQEALKRNAMRFDGVYHDAIQMALLLPHRA